MKNLALFLLFFVYISYGFENCLKLFNQEQYLKAEKCFSKISKEDPLHPYSLYYRILIKNFLEENYSREIRELEKYKDTAIYSYTNLFLSSFYKFKNPQKALEFWEKIDYRALSPEEIPFYYYLKTDILQKLGRNSEKLVKKISIEFPYDRTYGYPILMKNLKKLSEKDIFHAVNQLSKKRMYKRALNVLFFIPNSEKKYFYLSLLYGKLRKFDKAMYYLLKLKNKKLIALSSYTLIRLNPRDSIQNAYFQLLKETGEDKIIEKASDYMMRRRFYEKKYTEFFYFSNFVTKNSRYYPDKLWYRFLYLYQKNKKIKAAKMLEKNIKYFSDKSKVYYWLYLSYKNFNKRKAIYYLKKAAKIKNIDFYVIRAREKLKYKKFSILTFRDPMEEEKSLKMIKKLKDISYKYAYLEAKYYLKIGNKNKLSSVFPELTARYFTDKSKISLLSYPKPFYKIEQKNLIYAFMRRESFFDAYAISPSNAVGLMQIIPSTAKWIAKKIGDKDFDIPQLFSPQKNIYYGKWYIDYLKKLYNGNIIYTIAAYNAGVGNVKKALRRYKTKNIEEFIEFFPFEETRYYIKYVYTNLRAYQSLYGDK